MKRGGRGLRDWGGYADPARGGQEKEGGGVMEVAGCRGASLSASPPKVPPCIRPIHPSGHPNWLTSPSLTKICDLGGEHGGRTRGRERWLVMDDDVCGMDQASWAWTGRRVGGGQRKSQYFVGGGEENMETGKGLPPGVRTHTVSKPTATQPADVRKRGLDRPARDRLVEVPVSAIPS
jgi:hypothetical protein